MELAIIVEGKKDKAKLHRLMNKSVSILCTYGTPGATQLHKLYKLVGTLPVYLDALMLAWKALLMNI